MNIDGLHLFKSSDSVLAKLERVQGTIEEHEAMSDVVGFCKEVSTDSLQLARRSATYKRVHGPGKT